MRRTVLLILIILIFISSVSAESLTAPEVPDAGAKLMPSQTQSFGEGLWEIIQELLPLIRPDIHEALKISATLMASVLLVSIVQSFSDRTKNTAELAGVMSVGLLLFKSTHSLISLGIKTIQELSEYEKLLLPVLTAAIAAQGSTSTGAALYAGTALFNTLLSELLDRLLLPMIYLYLAAAVAQYACGEEVLGRIKAILKNTVFWTLKTLLSAFTAYMSITRVISGATDAIALKAAKITISSVVPIVGGILSEASEAVLVGAALIKNSVGIYGIYATLAVFLGPFVQIAIHNLILKYTAAVCSLIGPKRMSGVVDDFSSAMNLLLAATGAVCLLMLISCICFLKGVG